MKTQKQVYDLTPEDLQLMPIWEFSHGDEAAEGHDEASVRPVSPSMSLEEVDVMCVARAQFRLADGTLMSGYLSPGPGDAEVSHTQPTIVNERGQVAFWCGIVEPSTDQLEAAYKILGKRHDEVFPVSFSLDVPASHPLSGSIAGFLVLSGIDFKNVRVVH